ncbi:dual specificity tyrosine-phosphorylation-regulated kinase mbk-1-like [Leguminivora glycinivorella]|uniref:dual specificity tyrosine-phosphorylation-regulated kinase mbk-1-like n=1 Tax=Leguminivora glycinivorella TaxID=1035111 RepID=UPI00200ECBE8|nr:dual specificity tyrosine-phosphorylation-regulated kinase mbk-1-like [Leguminivora glycinivorella]
MLRFVTLCTLAVALSSAAPNPVSNVFEIDISPEEAAKYLNSPPFTEPQLSGRTGVLPLVRWNDPRFRSAEAGPTLGHYWKNGHEIENTDDYVEEVYDASQFHGQDGLGGYAYGYQAPESSKVENRARSGDVTGSYTYKDGNNELIKVRYWADSEGFHQEDNLPKVELKPVEEAADVREARLAHEKAWQEAAAAAAQNPDPQGEYHSNYDYNQAASEQQQNVVAPAREGKAFAQAQSSFQSNQYSQQQQYQQQPQKQYQQPQKQYQQPQKQQYQQPQKQQQYQQQQQHGQQQEEPEPTGPPRGFFYSFNYPVSIIEPKSGQQPGAVNPGQTVDHDTVGVSAHAQYHQG